MKVTIVGEMGSNRRFAPDNPILFADAFAQFNVGDRIDITVDKHRVKRTTQQNKYLWGKVYADIGTHISGPLYDAEEVHSMMKMKFNYEMKIVKVTQISKKTGKTRTIKRRIKVPLSTTNLSTYEFGVYIEKIRAWAAEYLNLIIPDAKTAGY